MTYSNIIWMCRKFQDWCGYIIQPCIKMLCMFACTVQVKPKISSCRATLYASSPEIEIANCPCYADDVTPIPVWVRLPPGSNSFSSISVNWDAEVNGYYYAMPAVSYVTPSPFQMGMTAAQCNVSVSGAKNQGQKRSICHFTFWSTSNLR